jgi:hypothetical protein
MSSDVKLPPGFTINWNIGPKDSVVEQDFVVTEYRVYRFEIKFSSTRESANPLEETKRMFKFAGDGRHHRVNKESADTDQPIVVPEYTQEELEFMKNGGSLVEGEYYADHPLGKNQRLHSPPPGTVWKSASSGVLVPVHIKIVQVDRAGVANVHTDRLVNTENIEGAGGLIRLIAGAKLRPGKYRLPLNTVKETLLPPDIETFLRAAAVPTTRVLKDNE